MEEVEEVIDDSVVPTMCRDWSLNNDKLTERNFWWHGIYGMSIWADSIVINKTAELITDDDVWSAYLQFQLENIFKLCSVCHKPEGDEDLHLCCFCGSTVHLECSKEAETNEISKKNANIEFIDRIRVCKNCVDAGSCDSVQSCVSASTVEAVNNNVMYSQLRRSIQRTLSICKEFPESLVVEIREIVKKVKLEQSIEECFCQLCAAVTSFFQPIPTLSLFQKCKIESKGNGMGVITTRNIPALTLVGIYPGYLDLMSGEQVKLGRPAPKYALMDLNCADYNNLVFSEFGATLTPYINEPSNDEESNCAWIQEVHCVEGRLSIITIQDVDEGSELLIGYGPLYPRQYNYTYDAYSLQRVEGYNDPYCYALWHWKATEASEGEFVNYVGYSAETKQYFIWKDEEIASSCNECYIDRGIIRKSDIRNVD